MPRTGGVPDLFPESARKVVPLDGMALLPRAFLAPRSRLHTAPFPAEGGSLVVAGGKSATNKGGTVQKIPTVWVRDPDTNLALVKSEVHPACQWVIDGEGVATRKFDGTCVMFDGGQWWARREVKAGKSAPDNFQPLGTDPTTGKTMGWEPAHQSGWVKFLDEATTGDELPGTYELCGPRIQANPEGFPGHILVPHGQDIHEGVPRTFDGAKEYLRDSTFEGFVWHHPDGRMGKIKRRDFDYKETPQ